MLHFKKTHSVEDTETFKKVSDMAMKITYEGEEIANKSYFNMLIMQDTNSTSYHGMFTEAFEALDPRLTISNSVFYAVSDYSKFKQAIRDMRERTAKSRGATHASLKLTIAQLQAEVESLRKAIG